MNQGRKLVNSTNVFVYHTERDLFYNADPPFLLPTPPHLRLPSVPISAEACWRPKIPADVTSSALPVYRSLWEQKTRRTGKRFKRPAQRKPEKSNSTPQSTYPVSLAFNRMLLIASCIIFSVFKGWTGKGLHWGRIPWNVYGVLIAKCDYLKIKINLYSPKPSSYSSELSEVKKNCKDLLLQKTSGDAISVALGELRGRKWHFYRDFNPLIYLSHMPSIIEIKL